MIKSLLAICLVAGFADIFFINLYLAPHAFPPQPEQSAQVITPKIPHSSLGGGTESTSTRTKTISESSKQEKPIQHKRLSPNDNTSNLSAVKPPAKSSSRSSEGKPYVIRFDTAKWQMLTSEDKKALDKFFQAYKTTRGKNFLLIVEGHTDSRGSKDFNYRLSWLRAQTIADYFRFRGLPKSSIKIKALGPSSPEDPSDSPSAWALNRRVVVTVQR